jgi:predicted metal-dependent phosphoesterase TrpH
VRFELHCHSTCSDGTEAPAAVAARAVARGVEVFALTDHDTCEGSGLPVGTARSIRAVEMSCDDGGHTIHVLAFARATSDFAPLEARLADVRAARASRLRVMVTKLARRGITIDPAPLLAMAAEGKAVGRPDLARAMVEIGAASSMRDAFSRHLYDDGPVYVPHRTLPITEALALGVQANAAMALAHPHLYDHRSVSLVKRYHRHGLTGIEAFYGVYDPRERARWVTLADELGLTCTGGSDWHGPDDAITQPGVDLTDERSDALLRWLE